MRAGTDPMTVVWAAALCVALTVLAARRRDDTRRRARRLLLDPGQGADPERGVGGGPGPSPAGEPGRAAQWWSSGKVLAWLRDVLGRGLPVPPVSPVSPGRWYGRGSGGREGWRVGRRRERWREGRRVGGRREGWRVGKRRETRSGPTARFGRQAGPEIACLPVGGLLALLTGSVVPVLAGAAAVPLVGRALGRRVERAAAERRSAAVSALCGTVGGELRAGRPPHLALADAVESAGWPRSPDLAGAARLLLSAARFGGDVPHALREAARRSEGAHGLAAVAACWQVAVDGGAGLAAALDRVAAALRADADQRDDLRAQLAGPRSTAVLLALLPLFGVVLGAGLGADPSAVLLHTPPGLLCLLAGGLLEWAGLAWTSRIIRSAEGGSGGGRRPDLPDPAAPPDLPDLPDLSDSTDPPDRPRLSGRAATQRHRRRVSPDGAQGRGRS